MLRQHRRDFVELQRIFFQSLTAHRHGHHGISSGTFVMILTPSTNNSFRRENKQKLQKHSLFERDF